MFPVSNRHLRAFLAALLVVLILGLGILLIGRRPPASPTQNSEGSSSKLFTSFTQNGVHVEINLEKDSTGLNLVATYRTPNELTHIYSMIMTPDRITCLRR